MRLKLILISIFGKSVTQSFWDFAQSTAVILLCSVQNFTTEQYVTGKQDFARIEFRTDIFYVAQGTRYATICQNKPVSTQCSNYRADTSPVLVHHGVFTTMLIDVRPVHKRSSPRRYAGTIDLTSHLSNHVYCPLGKLYAGMNAVRSETLSPKH